MRAWLLVAVVATTACKRTQSGKDPFAKYDAAVVVGDAAEVPIDAAVVKTPPKQLKTVIGDAAACAVLADATLWCWGTNASGQLGDGTTTDAPMTEPVQPNLRGVIDVVLGDAHACALLDDESVTCWGGINYGKRENLLKPAAVPGLAKAKRIFAVGKASCATTDNAALVCWGEIDVRGHLRATGERRGPTPSRGLEHVMALTATGALHEDGSVSRWGRDGEPIKTALAGITEIAAYGAGVCGLQRDGTVACVGAGLGCAKTTPQPKKKGKGKGKGKGTPETVDPIEILKLPPARQLTRGPCIINKRGKSQCVDKRDPCVRRG